MRELAKRERSREARSESITTRGNVGGIPAFTADPRLSVSRHGSGWRGSDAHGVTRIPSLTGDMCGVLSPHVPTAES